MLKERSWSGCSFRIIDNDGTIPADNAFDVPDLMPAIRQA